MFQWILIKKTKTNKQIRVFKWILCKVWTFEQREPINLTWSKIYQLKVKLMIHTLQFWVHQSNRHIHVSTSQHIWQYNNLMHTVNLNDQNPLLIQPHQSMISVSNSPIFQFYASSIKIIIITIIYILRTNKKYQQALNVYRMINLNNIFNTHTHTHTQKQIMRISKTLRDTPKPKA